MISSRGWYRVLVATIAAHALAGCGESPESELEEIPREPASIRFDEIEADVDSIDSAARYSSAGRLVTTVAPGVSCLRPAGEGTGVGEVTLVVAFPEDAEPGDTLAVVAGATGSGAAVSVTTGSDTFIFSSGRIVLDDLSRDTVRLRVDVESSDGLKSVRGEVSAVLCLEL